MSRLIAAILAGVVLLFLALPESAFAMREQPELTTRLDVPVYVDASLDYEGFSTEELIVVRPWVASGALNAAWQQETVEAKAVYVLAHELGHVSGINSEYRANVYAANHYLRVAVKLGVRFRAALRLWQTLPQAWRQPV